MVHLSKKGFMNEKREGYVKVPRRSGRNGGQALLPLPLWKGRIFCFRRRSQREANVGLQWLSKKEGDRRICRDLLPDPSRARDERGEGESGTVAYCITTKTGGRRIAFTQGLLLSRLAELEARSGARGRTPTSSSPSSARRASPAKSR